MVLVLHVYIATDVTDEGAIRMLVNIALRAGKIENKATTATLDSTAYSINNKHEVDLLL